MSHPITGQSIVITGAGSGIGAATAIACAKAGMNVVMSDRNGDGVEAIAREIRQAGGAAATIEGDVTGRDHSALLLDEAARRAGDAQGGALFAVFANAGIAIEAPMAEITADQLRRIFDVNFFAAVDLLQQAAARMIAAGRPGRLLMCSSCLGRMGLPFYGGYCATKAAQMMVCKTMNLELRGRGIFVSSVHPIATRTNMFESAAEESGLPPGSVQIFGKTPKVFIQDPERVARAIVRALRKENPPPEIWTSHLVRIAAGAMTMFPRFNDWVMRDEARRGYKGLAPRHASQSRN